MAIKLTIKVSDEIKIERFHSMDSYVYFIVHRKCDRTISTDYDLDRPVCSFYNADIPCSPVNKKDYRKAVTMVALLQLKE